MDNKIFEKQADEVIAEIIMSAESDSGIQCADSTRNFIKAAYIAGGYRYASMLEMERQERVAYLTRRFGDSTQGRLDKAQEELSELVEAYKNAETVEDFEDFLEELGDVTLVLFHIAGIFSKSQEELVAITLEKVKMRETNPNYKRDKAS